MSAEYIVCIHQPNFFPWLGFFDKIARSDCLILLDHVQLPKSGGTWTNRVKLLFINGEAKWVTVPIIRTGHSYQQINQIKIHNESKWQGKFLKTLQRNYSRAPYYHEVSTFLLPLFLKKTDTLSEFNCNSIVAILGELKFSTRCILSSNLAVHGSSNEMLIALVKSVDGTTYLCGDGAGGYIDEKAFSDWGINLVYQKFQHPVYPQKGADAFQPGLSIIDALMNVGFEGVRTLLKQV